ncbi:MAG: M15 family metallopeptidase [Bacilli bacterium]|nr:M15 family metallopeptidase [Bacilli bacterium]
MKKGIYILSGLVIIFSILCLIKDKRKENEVIKNNNPYEIFSFYKEENLNRYEKYFNNNNLSYKDTILRVNIGLDNSFYTNTKEIINFDKLMLVNKYNYVSESFKVPNLVEVSEFAKDNMYLEKECMTSFIKMARDASINGLNLRAISTYRTYEYQENLYNNYLKSDGLEKADTYSARPGFSEHHTGLAIDLDNIKTSYMNFENTKEFTWMKENAYKYGFILRYPKDKENITGYMYEAWHYRYVGTRIATYIHENNITYEEYYYEFLDK